MLTVRATLMDTASLQAVLKSGARRNELVMGSAAPVSWGRLQAHMGQTVSDPGREALQRWLETPSVLCCSQKPNWVTDSVMLLQPAPGHSQCPCCAGVVSVALGADIPAEGQLGSRAGVAEGQATQQLQAMLRSQQRHPPC